MRRSEFEALVREGYAQLPEWVRGKIKNVALLTEDEPEEETRSEEGLEHDETLLGLYCGIPQTARGEGYGVGATLPDTITLYQKPIEEAALEEGIDVKKVIADTIWHEFAHHFGMDESQVRARERGRGKKT